MTFNLRIATMNCENPFSRPRIFQSQRNTELLGCVNDLNEALSRRVFDHERINGLKHALAGYAEMIDVRGSHLSASGVANWLGWIELKRTRHDDAAIENTARGITDIDAVVICLCEVENRPLLQRCHNQLMIPQFLRPAGKAAYGYLLLVEGNDPWVIGVAILSRHPFDWVGTHMYGRTEYQVKTVPRFSRDCLEARLQLSSGSSLTVLLNRFTSMGYSSSKDPQSNNRRFAQARRVAEIANTYDLDHDHVVVAGDLNADPTSWSMAPLVKHPTPYNVVLELPAAERGTYQKGKKRLNSLLVSQPASQRLISMNTERRVAYAKTKWNPYPTVTGLASAASDHSAVVADSVIP